MTSKQQVDFMTELATDPPIYTDQKIGLLAYYMFAKMATIDDDVYKIIYDFSQKYPATYYLNDVLKLNAHKVVSSECVKIDEKTAMV